MRQAAVVRPGASQDAVPSRLQYFSDDGTSMNTIPGLALALEATATRMSRARSASVLAPCTRTWKAFFASWAATHARHRPRRHPPWACFSMPRRESGCRQGNESRTGGIRARTESRDLPPTEPIHRVAKIAAQAAAANCTTRSARLGWARPPPRVLRQPAMPPQQGYPTETRRHPIRSAFAPGYTLLYPAFGKNISER